MKRLILSLIIACAISVAHGQYYYPYDSSNFYYDDSPSLIIQKDRIMGWYVSDMDGKRISDYYEEIRPFSQGHAAVKDKIMGWCFIDVTGKRCSDYYTEVDDYHDGYALVKDKVMGWTFIDGQGKRLVSDYYDEAYPFHRGVALVKDKVMGWYLLNTSGKRITDYHKTPWDFKAPTPPRRPW
ncbi:MAG: WG repeat-containing protein [Muribaculum sp.]|nr:WG repeat-containing protein [Muribaculum sp.]